MSGTLTRGSQSAPATVMLELPNKIRIDQGAGNGATLVFNGSAATSSAGAPKEADQDLLESFLDDGPESMLANLRQTSLRIIARRARLDDGAWASILELIGPVTSRTVSRQKDYEFDFGTQLPVVTRYRLRRGDGTIVLVETARKNWTTVSGEAVPGDIVRSENGTIVAAFHVTGATFSAAANDGSFGSGK